MIYLLIKIKGCVKPLLFSSSGPPLEVLTKVRSTVCDHRMDGNELVHKEIRFVTLALLPLTQVGCGPRGLAKLELGDCKLEKERAILQMTISGPYGF